MGKLRAHQPLAPSIPHAHVVHFHCWGGIRWTRRIRFGLIENLASALTEALAMEDEPRIGLPGV